VTVVKVRQTDGWGKAVLECEPSMLGQCYSVPSKITLFAFFPNYSVYNSHAGIKISCYMMLYLWTSTDFWGFIYDVKLAIDKHV